MSDLAALTPAQLAEAALGGANCGQVGNDVTLHGLARVLVAVQAERDDLRTVEEAARATVKEAGCYSNGIPQSSTARALYDALAALDARREVLDRHPKAPA